MDFQLSENETPKDGSCLFHGLLDQLKSNTELQDEASSAQELRWKIVNYGYDFFLKTKKLTWVNTTETPEDWRKKMSDPNEWGDDVALASNSRAFEKSTVHKDLGLTINKSLEKSNPEPLYLFITQKGVVCR